MSRDFAGYANQYPDVRWPNGAQLAVSMESKFEGSVAKFAQEVMKGQ